MNEYVSTATATIRLPMSTSAGAAGDRAPVGAIRVTPLVDGAIDAAGGGSCCGGACCRDAG